MLHTLGFNFSAPVFESYGLDELLVVQEGQAIDLGSFPYSRHLVAIDWRN